ncbi:MAG: hypothetical protein HS114_34550 [Anaerolineales bacterium]|nr:hypothetical protein [Anaerolineales bacterium]
MIPKTLEVSISKEEIRTVDESGTRASTWVKIGRVVELEPGDIPDMCIKALRAEIQPEVDAWLLDQGGYIGPVGEDSPIDQTYSPHADIPEIGEGGLIELFGDTEIEISQVEEKPAATADEVDEIPL